MLRRATQAVPSSDVTRLVSDAARRASKETTAKRSRGGRNFDLIAVGLASFVAATALKNRRDHEERNSLLQAELTRAEQDRDSARHAISRVRSSLLDTASEAITLVDDVKSRKSPGAAADKTIVLQMWIEEVIEKSLAVSSTEEDAEGPQKNSEKPKLI